MSSNLVLQFVKFVLSSRVLWAILFINLFINIAATNESKHYKMQLSSSDQAICASQFVQTTPISDGRQFLSELTAFVGVQDISQKNKSDSKIAQFPFAETTTHTQFLVRLCSPFHFSYIHVYLSRIAARGPPAQIA